MSEVWEKILGVVKREGPDLKAIFINPGTAKHLKQEFEDSRYYTATLATEYDQSNSRVFQPGYIGCALGVDYFEDETVPPGDLKYLTVRTEGVFTIGNTKHV